MDRSRSVDLLKLCMALFVVGIHSNPLSDVSRLLVWLSGDGLYRVAVPVFLVINGYYFQAFRGTGKTLPYLRRMIGLYVLWMALYLPLYWQVLAHSDLLTSLRLLLLGWWHLWYLSGLVLAAAIAALVGRWSTRHLLILIALTFAAGVAVQYAQAFGLLKGKIPVLGSAVHLHRNGLFLCLPFFLTGLLIRRHDLPARLDPRQVRWAAGGGVALVIAESAALHAFAPAGWALDNMIFIGLASPALVILAVQGKGQGTGKTLGYMSSGIYFLHVAFVSPLMRHTDLSHSLVALIAVAGSVALTWGILKLRLERRLF